MKCHYCGTPLRGSEIFCRYCGTRQTVTEEPEQIPMQLPVYEEAQPLPVPEAPAPQPERTARTVTAAEERRLLRQDAQKAAPLFGLDEEPMLESPRIQLPTGRGLGKMIFLGLLTLGIYPVVIWSRLVGEVNMVASRYDGARSMSFFGMLLLMPVTLGIHSLVWIHKLCRRIGAELDRRRVKYSFGPKEFWVWAFLITFFGAVCIGVGTVLLVIEQSAGVIHWILAAVAMLSLIGPCVFVAKLLKAMNCLNEDFNKNG